jgi:hypothetical protein
MCKPAIQEYDNTEKFVSTKIYFCLLMEVTEPRVLGVAARGGGGIRVLTSANRS